MFVSILLFFPELFISSINALSYILSTLIGDRKYPHGLVEQILTFLYLLYLLSTHKPDCLHR